MKRNSTFSGRFALTGIAAAALCLAMPPAWSLGLGRLQVQSALGESLRAEIDVTSITPEESSNLRIKIASPDEYRAAGVEYNAVLPNTRAELLRRADGRPYLKITSDRGVQEPFVDVILEMTWATGRLVREYTMLFDPPATARAPAPAPVISPSMGTTAPGPALAMAAAPTPAPVAAPVPTPALRAETPPAAERRAPAPRAVDRSPPPVARAARPAAPAAAPDSNEYKVKVGDSLSKIAERTQKPGVSLDQMLVALYRNNSQAFMDNNMNRLKAGVVLSVPSAEAAKGTSPVEARQVIQAQSADFGAFRQKLAGMAPAARTESATRQASGRVQSSVEDRQSGAAATPDKLTLSKGAASAKSAASEEQISKERAKKAEDVRLAELAKNVDELKKLSGATAAASATKPAASAAKAPAVAAAPAPIASAALPTISAPPAVVAALKPPVAPVPAVAPAPASAAAPVPAAPASVAAIPAAPVVATAQAPAPATAPAPAPAVVAAASAPTPKLAASVAVAAKPSVIPSAPVEEPGLLGSLIDDNPMALGLGGLAIALLAGLGIYGFTKRAKKDASETSFLESRLQPDSFFGASGGQRIDTRDAGGTGSSMSYSLSQLDAIGDVDPVAEADVYLAYGRDLQAEEILKEAMRSTPDRLAIRTKLLEVYAKRRDTKGFELLATQLYALTRGEGEDWAKAQEMGSQIDPENPLFMPGGAPIMAQGSSGEMVEPLGASTMPQSVLPSPSQFGTSLTGVTGSDSAGMDLDLDLDDFVPAPTTVRGAFPPSAAAPFKASPPPVAAATVHKLDDDMSLDFSLPEPTPSAVPKVAAAAPLLKAPSFDLSSISLDLGAPVAAGASAAVAATAAAASHAKSAGTHFDELDLPSIGQIDDDPLSRKLELAEEFRQIGDTDGARELLHEVVAKSSGSVKSRAQSMLADLD